MPRSQEQDIQESVSKHGFDYSHVPNPARVAVYDDLKSAPHVITVEPNGTRQFIGTLAATIHREARAMGGNIGYTPILEMTENFIHARFQEVVVSILDNGNTIRFADQGPGIMDKEKAQLPGFTSATAPMTEFIRGVGSGIPIVKEYMDSNHGYITIEDNINNGAVVTISSLHKKQEPTAENAPLINDLNDRQRQIITLLRDFEEMGVTELANAMDLAPSSISYALSKLEDLGYIAKSGSKKRLLTPLGERIAASL